MRSDEDGAGELPEPREPVDGGRAAWPDGHPAPWEHGPQTPAERTAARRRLDRLADQG